MILQRTHSTLPFVPNPCAPYGAQGLDSSILIWHDDQENPTVRFLNPFQTSISVVDWSHYGSILLAGSMTGEVLAWDIATGERVLANRYAHSYAPICGLSWAPGGVHLVAITMARTIQIWHVATRTCLVLPCQGSTTTVTWNLDGSGFKTNDGVVWSEREGGRSWY
jgi:WD40 repeat protein